MSKTKINWGVLGCAGIAEKHTIPGLLQASNACLYAIASRSAGSKLDEFAALFKPVKTYTSYEDLLSDPEIDAVYIPLPNSLHAEWVMQAAAHKKHVLCEKPLGVKAAEVVAMKQACDENGVLLMEAFAYRQSPLTLKVKALIDEGRIGEVKFIDAHFNYLLADLDNVRMKSDLQGGATYDVGCYNIDLIRYLAGAEPNSVFATGEIGPVTGVDESSCIIMEFANDMKALSYCSFKTAPRSEYTVAGTAGIMSVPARFNFEGQTAIIIRNGDQVEEIPVDCPDNYMLEIEQFGRCILDGEKPVVSFESSLGNARVIDMALDQIFRWSEQDID